MNKLLESALKMSEMGLYVHPLKSNSKIPLLNAWPKLPRADTKKIESWWKKYPDANVGIITGKGLIVIDIDNKNGKNGESFLDEWQFANSQFNKTYAVRTPSGGKHLYYWVPENINIKQIYSSEGIDLQTEGKQVVAAGSFIGDNSYEIISSMHVASANAAVLAFILGKECYRAPEGTGEGERDSKLTSFIWQKVNEGYTEEMVLQLAKDLNSTFEPEGLEENTVIYKVKKAFEKHNRMNNADMINYEELEPEDVEWLWHPYIPKGKLTIIAGAPGVGKTFLETELAAIISTGRSYPGEDLKRSPGTVIIQNTEDGIRDTILKRLSAAKADLRNIKSIDTSKEPIFFGDPRIEDAMNKYRPDIMVFDPFQSFFGKNIDLNRSNQTRPVFDQILNLAEKYKVAVIMVMHLSKMTNASAVNRILGSVDVVGSVRSVLVVVDHPKIEGQKVIAHEKSNLAQKGESLCYSIQDGRIIWEGFTSLTADECLQGENANQKGKPKLENAAEFLENHLKETGSAKVADLKTAAQELGIKWETVKKAKVNLGLESKKEGYQGEYFWYLP